MHNFESYIDRTDVSMEITLLVPASKYSTLIILPDMILNQFLPPPFPHPYNPLSEGTFLNYHPQSFQSSKILYEFLASSIWATCLAHHNLLDVTTITILHDLHKPLFLLLWNIHCSPLLHHQELYLHTCCSSHLSNICPWHEILPQEVVTKKWH